MRVAVYTRVSKDRFGDERSNERQETACRSFSSARDWLVVAAFRDVDISAYKDVRRPGYEGLVSAIEGHRCDAICVWKLDRLVRRPREFEQLWETCERNGVALVSVTEPIDTSTDLGLAVVRVLVTFASLESATKSVRLKAAYHQRALTGAPHPGVRRVFGLNDNWTELIPDEADLVREAAHRVLGGETMASVVRDWTLRGLRTTRGALWSVHRLRDLLTSPRLWGMRVYRGEIVAAGTWPAILSREDGARLQYLLADPSRRREPPAGRPSLLTGLLRCGKCGSRMVTRRSTRGDPTYCCPSPPRGCNGTSVRQRPADGVVTEVAVREFRKRQDEFPEVAFPLSDEVAVLVDRHARALHEAAGDYYVRSVIDRSTFLSVRDTLDRSLFETFAGVVSNPVPERFRGLCTNPTLWEALPHADRRAALSIVVDHVVIHPAPRSSGRFRPERVEVVLPGQRSIRSVPPSTDDLVPNSLLSAHETAVALGLCDATVHRMLRSGALTGTKSSGHWLISGAEVVRCRELRRLAGVKRVRRSSRKFDRILLAYNAERRPEGGR